MAESCLLRVMSLNLALRGNWGLAWVGWCLTTKIPLVITTRLIIVLLCSMDNLIDFRYKSITRQRGSKYQNIHESQKLA